jgi:hypothetical protein
MTGASADMFYQLNGRIDLMRSTPQCYRTARCMSEYPSMLAGVRSSPNRWNGTHFENERAVMLTDTIRGISYEIIYWKGRNDQGDRIVLGTDRIVNVGHPSHTGVALTDVITDWIKQPGTTLLLSGSLFIFFTWMFY